jgi:hypothetical protein
MLNLLDLTLRQVLDSGWTPAPPPSKPGFFFTIPDDAWQTRVRTDNAPRLNLYLYEVRENRDFRRAEWDALPGATVMTTVQSQPPVYLDCHYLVSAWSPAEDTEATTPVLDEHLILAEALRVFLRTPTVTPRALGIAGGSPVFQQAEVCLSVAPPEAPRVLNDFWSTMRLPWRPAIQVVATAPLDLLVDLTPAPRLTTLIERYTSPGQPGGEVRVSIGGWVLRAADDTPLAGATVERLSLDTAATLESMATDAQGRFFFQSLAAGPQRLRASQAGFNPLQRDLDLPNEAPDDHVFRLS